MKLKKSLLFPAILVFLLSFPISAHAAFRFVSLGDAQNESGNFAATAKQAGTLNPAIMIFNGDIENDGVTSTGFTTMTSALGPLYSKAFLVRGNHDDHVSGSASIWSGLQNNSAKALSLGVKNYTELNSNLTFSYDYDNVRFIGVDAPGDTDLVSSAQINWIDQRLSDAELNHPEIQHAFLYWHGPLYCVESTHCGCSSGSDSSCTPSSIITMLNKHPIVSATFHGHEHILGWTHISSARMSNVTHEFEQFITSPSGGWTYNQYVFPARMDYYYPSMSSSQGFAAIDVNGTSFTFNIYKVGTTAPVYSKTFVKGGVVTTPTVTPTITPTPTPVPTQIPFQIPTKTPTPIPTPAITIPPTGQNVTATLIKTTSLSSLSPASPDPSGITYLSGTGRILISDSEVDEIPLLYTGTNLFETSYSGSLLRTGAVTNYSREPSGVTYNPDDNQIFLTDDDQTKVFKVGPGPDNLFGSADDTYTNFNSLLFNASDPEGIAYALISGQKYLFIADGVNHKVYQTTLAGNLVNSFDLSSLGFSDLEGITFNKTSGTLYVLDLGTDSVAEITTNGTLVRRINISAANLNNPADLTFAPGSTNPATNNLYIVDRGVDNNTDPNENDGKMFEMSVPQSGSGPATPTNPLASTSAPTIPGDSNGDMNVDETDYSAWRSNYLKNVTGGPKQGDFSDTGIPADGKVNGLDYAIWFNHFTGTANAPTSTPKPTMTPTSTTIPTVTKIPTSTITPTTPIIPTPTLQPSGSRILKYYGVDRGSPFSDTNYKNLADHSVKTIIVDTFINDASNSTSSKWQNIKTLAAKYNFKYVIWPNQGGDVAGCGWETPFNPPDSSGNYIWRVTAMLDSFSQDPNFIGMISAHEPMWNTSTCKTSIKDMTTIRTQLKNYMTAKGRSDFKVWNYIDNISDLKNMSGFVTQDIQNVMDVAVTWQHCFGGAEGTCPQAKQKIINDRALITNAGLEGKVELMFLFQTFGMGSGSGYTMPTLTEMQTWPCQFLSTGAVDGFMYYTWGAWYTTDLINHSDYWPTMNDVYNQCVVKN